MMRTADDLSRIDKILIDRDGLPQSEATRRRRATPVVLAAGVEIADSRTLQAAFVTAAALASRCFPGMVVATFDGGRRRFPLLLPKALGTDLQDAVGRVAGRRAVEGQRRRDGDCMTLAFGTVPRQLDGVQVSFDRWSAMVSPTRTPTRLRERDGCAIAGVLAGALGVSEIFLRHFGITAEATLRTLGLSLWRPDLPGHLDDAAGPVLEWLPAEVWLMGLGHLGQAYLWNLAMLPYSTPGAVDFVLNDHDRVSKPNRETGIITRRTDVGRPKARVAAEWLEAFGFRTRVVERRFDERTRPRHDEPGLLLCGVDRSGPRHLLEETGFDLVVEAGVGGRADNFDAIAVHRFPGARSAASMWPETKDSTDEDDRVRRLAEANREYRAVRDAFGCGHLDLAGVSVAVPFVGAVAGSLVVSECLRGLHEGERFEEIQLRLENARPYWVTGSNDGNAPPPVRLPSVPAAAA